MLPPLHLIYNSGEENFCISVHSIYSYMYFFIFRVLKIDKFNGLGSKKYMLSAFKTPPLCITLNYRILTAFQYPNPTQKIPMT